ncbi:PIN/TRAM domain-containing protein [Aerococcus tenax]|uniref:PIN/TRAM domain-containing protein n=1 Tax=Aerococcus tenax TaxID=3078812 RepID=UPI0018E0FAE8|nr:PIN domain-containing protein [Aerococcus tenax]
MKRLDVWAKIIDFLWLLVGAGFGYYLLPILWRWANLFPTLINQAWINIIIGALIFLILIKLLEPLEKKLVRRLEKEIRDLPISNILIALLGIVMGLILAWLINIPLIALDIYFISNVLPVVLTILFAFLGYFVLWVKSDEILAFFRNIRISNLRDRVQDKETASDEEEAESEPSPAKSDKESGQESAAWENFKPYKILDTSVIIDGRILDVLKTGIIEGTILVPNFVLKELQYIADSSDASKRVRGRRGLDVLNAIQALDDLPVEFYAGDFEEEEEVDLKLLLLAKEVNGVVVTNDYNLNKVSHFHQIKVLNLNELANAMKTVVIPGDRMQVHIIKKGTERQQGVGYLDDGTMIVVEEGRLHMDEELEVEVTSAIQTNAGKMIFAKLADD